MGGRVKRTIFLLVIISLVSFFGYSGEKKIYAWKDKNGVLVFSDTPKSGAKEVKLTTQNLTMPAVDTRILDDQNLPKVINYKIAIASPADEATVRENTGSVYVSSRITPRFENGFTVQLFFDGSPYEEPSNTSTFALRNVNRGEHTLQVKLFDSQGNIIANSPTSTFFMHRASSL